MEPLGIVPTAHLFPGLHRQLMELLRSLTPEDWTRPTLAPAWSVRDVVAHLLDSQVRRLACQRDGHSLTPPGRPLTSYADLVGFLNELNADWIRAARRLSPALLMQFLEVTGPQVAWLLNSRDPHSPALFPVAWAGESESEHWFDTGREYTEWWHHQAQIREAVGAPPLLGREWLLPVLELSMKAFPRAFKGIPAASPAVLVFHVTGEAGGTWSVVPGEQGWSVVLGEASPVTARARCDADTAWRLFFNALSEDDARQGVEVEGDKTLGERVYSVRGVMV